MLQAVRDWFNAPWLNHCSCHICWNQADGRRVSRRGLALKLTRLLQAALRGFCKIMNQPYKNYSHVTLLKGKPASSWRPPVQEQLGGIAVGKKQKKPTLHNRRSRLCGSRNVLLAYATWILLCPRWSRFFVVTVLYRNGVTAMKCQRYTMLKQGKGEVRVGYDQMHVARPHRLLRRLLLFSFSQRT